MSGRSGWFNAEEQRLHQRSLRGVSTSGQGEPPGVARPAPVAATLGDLAQELQPLERRLECQRPFAVAQGLVVAPGGEASSNSASTGDP